MRSLLSATAIALLAQVTVAFPAASQDVPETYSGEEIYRLFCVVCHAPRGQGSPLGTSLISGDALARTDDEIINIISLGRPEKGMMSFGGSLSRDEIFKTMSYIRELQGKVARTKPAAQQAAAPAQPAGDTKLGEELFNGKAGCIQCHSYYNQGGMIGPDLNNVAARMTLDEIRAAVMKPSEVVTEGYEAAEVLTNDGKTLRGIARKETDKTIQLLNPSGDLWTTYFKDKLKAVKPLEGSLMPADTTQKLASDELDALIAFLGTLR